MFGWVKNIIGHEKQRRTFRAVHVPLRVRGRYDAAVTTDENRRHWASADSLSANAANSPQVRQTLRSRARYEVSNNSYARGIVLTLANPRVDSQVKLDLRLIEADQVTTPDLIRQPAALSAIDGIVFDSFGNPVEYHVLKTHPGDGLARFTLDYDRVPAASMIHYFRNDRPGQSRGIPEIR